MRKPVYLLLALLLPILIFIFLKFAGRNEFNIPVYYENGVESVPSGCESNYPAPYTLSNWGGLPKEQWRNANVLVFPDRDLRFEDFFLRMTDEFTEEELRISSAEKLTADPTTWKRCIFLSRDTYQTVLFDEQGRIRGYYDVKLREEEDRLRVELKILLKKY